MVCTVQHSMIVIFSHVEGSIREVGKLSRGYRVKQQAGETKTGERQFIGRVVSVLSRVLFFIERAPDFSSSVLLGNVGSLYGGRLRHLKWSPVSLYPQYYFQVWIHHARDCHFSIREFRDFVIDITKMIQKRHSTSIIGGI